jgi:alcohol dehydrogenase (cytochrome c)
MSLAVAARRFLAWSAVALALVVCAGGGALLYWKYSGRLGSATNDEVWRATLWRVQVFMRKARGDVPDLTWNELWHMARVRGAFGLGDSVKDGKSLEGSIGNAYVSDDDRKAGARLFRDHCAQCHGDKGGGFHAPPLNHTGFMHGDSDLALYKVVRDGISGMPALPLSLIERWQVIAYVRTLQETEEEVASGSHEEMPARIDVSLERVRAAGTRTDEWLTYSGSSRGVRYTPLSQITPANVGQLKARWVRQFDTADTKFEATPLVADGVMFVTEPPANVVALSVTTGQVLWKYSRDTSSDARLCCGRINRGLALLHDRVFMGTLDGYLVAIDANSGHMVWETKVADWSDGYSITGAPLVVNDSVIIGVAGGEYAIRGFIAAYSASTGKREWAFHTIPGPGEPGHESWKGGDTWMHGGGATWNTGSYDPSLGLVYWGVGNPAPVFSGDVRPGDNLFTNSVVAIHADSGKLAWYFQFTPHDEHDWDSTQTPILVDLVIKGVRRKVICWANRNGFYYVLDRVTGEFLAGTPFVDQNWARGLDARGRPIALPSGEVSKTGRFVRPGITGATNWQNAAIDETLGLVFIPATEAASIFTKSPNPTRGDRGTMLGSAGTLRYPVIPVVRAVDAATGAKRWERPAPPRNGGLPGYGGLLATGGSLVFGAADGHVFALDSRTGREAWRVELGGDTMATPISFTIDGRQVIAVFAGRSLFVFGL